MSQETEDDKMTLDEYLDQEFSVCCLTLIPIRATARSFPFKVESSTLRKILIALSEKPDFVDYARVDFMDEAKRLHGSYYTKTGEWVCRGDGMPKIGGMWRL